MFYPSDPVTVAQLPADTRGLVLTCTSCQSRTTHMTFGNGVALCAFCGGAQHQCHGKCGRWTSCDFALCDYCEAVRD